MKTIKYFLTLIITLIMSAAIASGDGTVSLSSRHEAGMILDLKSLAPVFPMQAGFDEKLLPSVSGEENFLPNVPATASFEEDPELDSLINLTRSLYPVVPSEADFTETLF